MSRFTAVLLAIIGCTSVLAEPIVYVCERPAWEGVEGCGPNDTYRTYGFWIDTGDLDTEADKAKFLYREPEYVYTEFDGCDTDEAYEKKGQFTSTERGFTFWLGPAVTNSTRVELDTLNMTAELKGHRIKHASGMTCDEVKGDEIKLVKPRPKMTTAPAFINVIGRQ